MQCPLASGNAQFLSHNYLFPEKFRLARTRKFRRGINGNTVNSASFA
jgi:hypothetical protein